MKFCSVFLFYFSFIYILFNGNTRYILVEIDVEKEQPEEEARYGRIDHERIGDKDCCKIGSNFN